MRSDERYACDQVEKEDFSDEPNLVYRIGIRPGSGRPTVSNWTEVLGKLLGVYTSSHLKCFMFNLRVR